MLSLVTSKRSLPCIILQYSQVHKERSEYHESPNPIISVNHQATNILPVDIMQQEQYVLCHVDLIEEGIEIQNHMLVVYFRTNPIVDVFYVTLKIGRMIQRVMC